MSKFSKGDKARVISVDSYDSKEGVKVGDIVTVNQSDSCCPWVILGGGRIYCLTESQMEHYTETPKEITLNGATYVLKEEPKPEHEWKFGDIAVHEYYGVGVVGCSNNRTGDVRFLCESIMTWVNICHLTFIRSADLSVPEKKDFKLGDKVYARRMYSLRSEKVTLLNKTEVGYNVKFEDGSVRDIHIDWLSANPF